MIKLFRLRQVLNEEDEIKTNSRLKPLWSAYENTFQDFNNVNKTNVEAEEFLNESNVLFAFLNYRLVNTSSNVLIGLGILGTFVGLTYGIADSDFTNTAAIKTSIDNLLSGMGTAFTTSIWGMLFSLLYTGMFKYQQTRISRFIQNKCFEFDKKYRITTEELVVYENQKTKTIISEVMFEYFVHEEGESKQYPKVLLKRIFDESVNQSKSLQSFSDDLAGKIEYALESIIEGNKNEISNLIEEQLVPVLNDLKHIKQESGTDMINDIILKLTSSLDSMMNEFKTSITGSTKQEMDGLSSKLLSISDNLTDFPDVMNKMSSGIADIVTSLNNTVVESIEKSKAEAVVLNRENKEIFENTTSEYKSTIEELQSNMKSILNTQESNIKQVGELNQSIVETLVKNKDINNQFDSVIDKSKLVISSLIDAHEALSINSSRLTNSSDNLASVTSSFKEGTNEYYNNNRILLDNYRDTIESTSSVSKSYTSDLRIIQDGIKTIFNEIQNGLNAYQETTSDSINKYLVRFSTSLSTAQDSLSSNIDALNDITEGLTESCGKLLKK